MKLFRLSLLLHVGYAITEYQLNTVIALQEVDNMEYGDQQRSTTMHMNNLINIF